MSALTEFWNPARISSPFGAARSMGRKHRGADWSHSATRNTPIPSPIAGVVSGILKPAIWHGFGHQISIKTAGNVVWSFAHLNTASRFGVGDRVNLGDVIGQEGRTGATTGICVHVERYLLGFHDPAPHMAQLLLSIDAANAPAPAGLRPNQGVRDGQNLLNRFGYGLTVDGINGRRTKAAVSDFQSKHGLVSDGILGPRTKAVMDRLLAPTPATSSLVLKVQETLRRRFPLYAGRLKLDGIDGPATQAALDEFQRRAGLPRTRRIDALTRRALGV